MSENQRLAALEQQVVLLTRHVAMQDQRINSLKTTLIRVTDVMAWNRNGQMSDRDAAGHLFGLCTQAQAA